MGWFWQEVTALRLLNTDKGYGLVTILLHWLMAVIVFGLFALGWWMTELTYYDDWYRKGPELHKAIGIILFCFWGLRLVWRIATVSPAPLPDHKKWEVMAAKSVHWLLYIVLLSVFVSGYMISTADGRPIDVFGIFSVPAFATGMENQEDLAGLVHFCVACVLVGLALLHGAAAIKHHIVDKDNTLRRMLNPKLND